MNPYVVGLLTAFAGAVFVGFLFAMLFSEGRANLNHYGEGLAETALAGTLFLLGAKELILYKPGTG